MASLASSLLDLRDLDRLAQGATPLHRLDPRAKVLATAAFLVTLSSYGRLEVSGLLPLAAFPMALLVAGRIPLPLVLRKTLLALPFLLLLGIWLPLLDGSAGLELGGRTLNTGWLALASLLVRGLLAVTVATLLVAVTGFGEVCAALARLGLPEVFIQQLLFLHRYLFVVGDETQRSLLARDLRAHGQGMGWREFPSFTGHLLLRSWERAERVHSALLARGFRGTFPTRPHPTAGLKAWGFAAGWAAFFLLCRLVPLPRLLGELLLRGPS